MYTHALVCSTLSTYGGQRSMSGVFSTALHLRSFPLKRKLCTGLQAQLARGDTVAEVSGEGRVRRTEQWDPEVSSCRYSQPKASHTLGESILSQLRAAWRTSQVCDSRLELLLPSFLPGSHSAIRIWLCQSLSFISGKKRNLECDRNQELSLWIQILLILCECPFHS